MEPDINSINSEQILCAQHTQINLYRSLLIQSDLNQIEDAKINNPMAFTIVPAALENLYANIFNHVEAGVC